MLRRVNNRAMRGRLMEDPEEDQQDERSPLGKLAGERGTMPSSANDMGHTVYAGADAAMTAGRRGMVQGVRKAANAVDAGGARAKKISGYLDARKNRAMQAKNSAQKMSANAGKEETRLAAGGDKGQARKDAYRAEQEKGSKIDTAANHRQSKDVLQTTERASQQIKDYRNSKIQKVVDDAAKQPNVQRFSEKVKQLKNPVDQARAEIRMDVGNGVGKDRYGAGSPMAAEQRKADLKKGYSSVQRELDSAKMERAARIKNGGKGWTSKEPNTAIATRPNTPAANIPSPSVKTVPSVNRYSAGKIAGKVGAVGKGAMMLTGAAQGIAGQGFSDQMRKFRQSGVYESDGDTPDAPRATPNPKKSANDTVSGTSTTADKKSTPPAAKLKPKGGTYKGPKPQTTEKPKKAAGGDSSDTTTSGSDVQTNDPEQMQQQMIQSRAAEFRTRLSAISMTNTGVKTGVVASPKPLGSKQQAKESASNFLMGVVNLREATASRKRPSEKRMAKLLGSTANIKIRQGTPVKHSFISNNGMHKFSGRPLAMRQKIMSEHKRKKFDLHPDFPDMNPIQVGAYFDELSDQGMLEPRKDLDPSMISNWGRKAGRVGGRLARKVRSFFTGVAKAKQTKESDDARTDGLREANTESNSKSSSDFCNFAVGNVRYPGECSCGECRQLIETSGTSFGALQRGGAQSLAETPEVKQKKQFAISRLMSRRKKFKRRVRESFEDSKFQLDREMEYHRTHPEPMSLTRRGNSYFQTSNTLRRIDNLAMTIAKTGLVMQGLNSSGIIPRLVGSYQKHGPRFWAKARQGAAMMKAALMGKQSVSESAHEGVFDKEISAARGKTNAHVAEFLDSPLGYVKNAAKVKTIRALKHIGLPEHLHYPVGAVGSLGVAAGAAYAGKRLLFDPLHKKVKALNQKLEDYQKQRASQKS